MRASPGGGARGVRPIRATGGHDPAKPTVALLTGGAGTNVADLLGPYEVLAGTGRVNTYVVSGAGMPQITAITECVLLSLERARFLPWADRDPAWRKRLDALVAGRRGRPTWG